MLNTAMKTEELFLALPLLSTEDLRRVQANAAALLTLPGGKKTATATGTAAQGEHAFARDLYAAITDLGSKRTQARSTPWPVFKKQRVFTQHFLPAAQHAETVDAEWFPKQTRAERLSMISLYAQLVLDNIAERDKLPVWTIISSTVWNLPLLVDRAFPGYARAGLLGKVQQRRTQPQPVHS